MTSNNVRLAKPKTESAKKSFIKKGTAIPFLFFGGEGRVCLGAWVHQWRTKKKDILVVEKYALAQRRGRKGRGEKEKDAM